MRCQTVWFAAPPAIAGTAHAGCRQRQWHAFGSELGAGAAPAPAAERLAAESAAGAAAGAAERATAGDHRAPTHRTSRAEGAAGAPADAADRWRWRTFPIPVDDAPPLVPAADGAAPPDRAAEIDNGPPDIESVAARRGPRRGRAGGATAAEVRLPLAIVALVARLRGAARLAQGHRAACAAARIVL